MYMQLNFSHLFNILFCHDQLHELDRDSFVAMKYNTPTLHKNSVTQYVMNKAIKVVNMTWIVTKQYVTTFATYPG